MKPNQFASFITPDPAADDRPAAAPAPEALAAWQPAVLKTFADVDDLIARHPDWPESGRGPARSTCRGVAARIQAIWAAERHEPFNPDPKALELASVPFDIAMINAAWKGRSYRAAGFNSLKSFNNARWTLRCVGRRAGMIIPDVTPPIAPGDPFEPLQHAASPYDRATARRFAAWCRQQDLRPEEVTDATLLAYRDFVMTHMIRRSSDAVIQLVARLWNATARRDPAWPQTKLRAPSRNEHYTLPFTAYPVSFQDDVAALTTWMAGTRRRRSPHRRPGRKRAMRPITIRTTLSRIRLAAAALVAGGRDPASITHLGCLVGEAGMEAILAWHEDRAEARRQARPDVDRVHSNAQVQGIAATLLMIAQRYCEVAPETLKALREIAADFHVASSGKPTQKNRRRIDVLLDDRGKLQRLLRLPRTLMDQALELREQSAQTRLAAGQASDAKQAERLTHKVVVLTRQAAQLAREAALIGILCRIPLRIGNLHTIRIGHNLRFAGGGSDLVMLHFAADETKNRNELEFVVGARLQALLQTYIEHFLPFFATGAADCEDQRWLFPSGGGRTGPLSSSRMRALLIRSIADHAGVTFNPHLFRGLAVTLALEHAPGATEHCRQLLGDKSSRVVQQHYMLTQPKQAARRQNAIVDAEEDRLAEAAPPPAKPRRRRQP